MRYFATYVGGILQGSLNDRLTEKHVSTTGTPQHPLKGRQTFPQDHSSHEAISGKDQGTIKRGSWLVSVVEAT